MSLTPQRRCRSVQLVWLAWLTQLVWLVPYRGSTFVRSRTKCVCYLSSEVIVARWALHLARPLERRLLAVPLVTQDEGFLWLKVHLGELKSPLPRGTPRATVNTSHLNVISGNPLSLGNRGGFWRLPGYAFWLFSGNRVVLWAHQTPAIMNMSSSQTLGSEVSHAPRASEASGEHVDNRSSDLGTRFRFYVDHQEISLAGSHILACPLCGSVSMCEATIRKHVLNNHSGHVYTWVCSVCEASHHLPKCQWTKREEEGPHRCVEGGCGTRFPTHPAC